jgi:Tfp pilus assembly protein PilP
MDSWSIGVSTDHYRCQQVYIKDTRAVRVTDTLVYKHRKITYSGVSAADEIASAASHLTDDIQNNMESKLLSLDMKELERLAEIFNNAAMEMADKDAKAPRVPSPRVLTNHNKESENLHPPTPRVDEPLTQPRYATRSQK